MKSIGIVGGRLSASWNSALRLPEPSLVSSMRFGRTRPISTSKSSRASHGKLPREIQTKIRDKNGSPAATLESDQLNGGYVEDASLLYPVAGVTDGPQTAGRDWKPSVEEEIYQTDFFQVLADGQPDRVMTMLTDPRSASLVGSLPQTVFIEALHRLSPAHFVEPIRDLHQHLHSWSSFVNGVKRIEDVFDDFVRNLFTIIEFRTAGDNVLELAEYTYLLDCARVMGNGPLADDIWEAMKRAHMEPDVACYNHWMAAKVWDKCYVAQENYRMRMLPYSYKKRRRDPPNIGWKGYQTGRNSVRRFVLEKFREMTAAGHNPDEKTYINVFLASARTGHKQGMQHVLKAVWNIDLLAMKETTDHSTLPPPTPFEPWSALHPTEDLIFAVAHGLGVTNDVPLAVQTVKLISTSYNIPIPKKVWSELLERAYVLSRERKTIPEDDLANTLGKVPVDLVHSIFEAMTSHPLNVEPDMPTRRRMIKIAAQAGKFNDCRLQLASAYDMLSATRRKEQEARAVVLDLLSPTWPLGRRWVESKRRDHSAALEIKRHCESPVLAQAITAYHHLRLEVYQQSYLLRRAAWLVLHTKDWQDITEEAWYLQARPKFQEEWRDFLPERIDINYGDEDKSAHVEFRGKTRFTDQHWCNGGQVPVRRHTDQELFAPIEPPFPRDDPGWRQFRGKAHEWMGTSIQPLNALFDFQKPLDFKTKRSLRNFREAWVEFPEDHPMSTENNPRGGLFARLTVLGMVKATEQRSVYHIDEKTELENLDLDEPDSMDSVEYEEYEEA